MTHCLFCGSWNAGPVAVLSLYDDERAVLIECADCGNQELIEDEEIACAYPELAISHPGPMISLKDDIGYGVSSSTVPADYDDPLRWWL
jgi:hypothetical protein